MIRDARHRVVFLIRSLNRGGAERQLALLAARLDPREFQVGVITFYRGGAIWDELAAIPHIALRSLDKRGRWDNVSAIIRLNALLRSWAPAVLHCYMTEPSILGAIVARFAGVRAVVWGVRSSNVDHLRYGRFNWLTFQVSAAMSRFASLIVANSDAGRTYHIKHGYQPDRFITIPNGIDTERFQFSQEHRAAMRARWGVCDDDFVIGVVARLDLMKDHETLLNAAAIVCRQQPNVRFVCVGGGSADRQARLLSMTEGLGLGERVIWAGELDELVSAYSAFDALCSSSAFGEGFSNAVAEAMACQRPCMVTDVGDSAAIVADTGLIVPCSDPARLAEAILKMATLPATARREFGDHARHRVVSRFNVETMVERTASIYRELARRSSDRPQPNLAVSQNGATRC